MVTIFKIKKRISMPLFLASMICTGSLYAMESPRSRGQLVAPGELGEQSSEVQTWPEYIQSLIPAFVSSAFYYPIHEARRFRGTTNQQQIDQEFRFNIPENPKAAKAIADFLNKVVKDNKDTIAHADIEPIIPILFNALNSIEVSFKALLADNKYDINLKLIGGLADRFKDDLQSLYRIHLRPEVGEAKAVYSDNDAHQYAYVASDKSAWAMWYFIKELEFGGFPYKKAILEFLLSLKYPGSSTVSFWPFTEDYDSLVDKVANTKYEHMS